MMIKAIATDMDGTLLNKSQKISKENKEAIDRARRNGIKVLIATGRSYSEAKMAMDEAGLSCPVIGVNGAALFNEQGAVEASFPMDRLETKSAAAILEEKNLYFEIYTNEGVFSKNYEKAIATLTDIFVTANPDLNPADVERKARQRIKLSQIRSVSSYAEVFSRHDLEFYKLLVFSENLKLLGDAAGELKRASSLAVTSSGAGNLEISSSSAQKGIVLEAYLKEQGIMMSEVMAIGDNFNDVSMFERAGRSVAMGNAPGEIQKQCDFVTESNENNGVAQAINRLLDEQGMS